MAKATAQQIDLIPEAPPSAEPIMVALEDIEPPDGALQPSGALIESVRRFGILQPLLLRGGSSGSTHSTHRIFLHYRLVDGRRRYRAAIKAELETVPALVLLAADSTADVMTLATGALRSDNTAEEARAVLDLLKRGASEEAIRQATGLTKPQIVKLARLQALHPALLGEFMAGRIKPGVAESAARLPGAYQSDLAAKVATAPLGAKSVLSGADVAKAKAVRAESAQEALAGVLPAPSPADLNDSARRHLSAAVDLLVPEERRSAALLALEDALASWAEPT